MNRVTQSNLLKIAVCFLILQTLIITLSPAVRERSLNVDYRWSQWIALATMTSQSIYRMQILIYSRRLR
jgi:hypothetical protein